MPLPSEKGKKHPQTPLSQTPRFNHTNPQWHENHFPLPHPLPSLFHFLDFPHFTSTTILLTQPQNRRRGHRLTDIGDIGQPTSGTSI